MPVNRFQRRRKYQHLNKRLLNLVLNPHRNIVDQLSALARNITLYEYFH